MPKRKDITGSKFGRLSAHSPIKIKSEWYYNCICECGNVVIVSRRHIVSGHTKSCGCYKSEVMRKNGKSNRIHGLIETNEYRSWANLKSRCFYKKNPDYKNYGARGITVCDRWKDSFENFLVDMGPKPSPKHSIDRIDNNGDYEPGNCRWSTMKEQSNNRSTNRHLTVNGETKTITEWAEHTGVSRDSLYYRLKSGLSAEKALKK